MRYKYTLQQDSSDCGPASISTICKYYHKKVNLSKVREVAGTDKQGTNLYGMKKACEYVGFHVKVLQAKEKKISSDLFLPAIAHLRYKDGATHYVVIYKITQSYLILADPGKGIVKKKLEDFVNEWSGFILLVYPSKEFNTKSEHISFFSRYKDVVLGERKLLTYIFLCSVIYITIGIGVSYYYSYVMDHILYDGIIKKLNIVTLLTILLYLVQYLLENLRARMQQNLSNRLDRKIMLGFYKHTLCLPLDFYETRRSGEILTRFMDAQSIRDLISGAALTLSIDTIMALAGGVFLAHRNFQLFLISLCILTGYAILVGIGNKPLEDTSKAVMNDNEDMTSYLIENVKGIENIKAYAFEREIIKGTEKRFNKYLKSTYKNAISMNVFYYTGNIIYTIGKLLIVWIGFMQVMLNKMSLGEVFMYEALLGYFLTPIENLIYLVPTLKRASVAAQRVNEIVDIETEFSEKYILEETDVSNDSIELNKDIDFNHVYFRYRSSRLLLQDVSFSIKKGEKVAFVGQSGSGKTTIAKLLMNYYKLESGEITIGGININNYEPNLLRTRVSYISQDMFLYPGSIIDNIKMGNKNASKDEIIHICKLINAHEFINELPQNYETKVGEEGVKLSYGQRQRIAIARALLKNPDILIMDEATSNLDSITERYIDNAIDKVANSTTVILIAHRLSTVMRCDRIFVVEKGEITDVGSHKELLQRDGLYAKMWKEQMDSNIVSF